MEIQDAVKEIEELQKEIIEKKKQLSELRQRVPRKKVENYHFKTSTGDQTTLLDLFKDKDELIVVHNMGRSCPYCTMWADGINGVYHFIEDHTSFVLSSPDSPEVQEDFSAERKWTFPMISTKDTTFKEDLGFEKDGYYYPGVSTFSKHEDGAIYLVASAPFGPGDDFCAVWPLFDLLPAEAGSYTPKKKINEASLYQLTNNVAIGVKDYQKAVEFYRGTIGMRLVKNGEKEAQFFFNGTNFYIENNPSEKVFFELAVNDFETAKAELDAAGCIVTKEYSPKSIMVQDPYGMNFHLYESK
ncbi:DUF899 family protein [Falsibacillus pallidus]|uniref:Putative dithiol-disulfide oxidoreductase (DUF899 family) n=1 Tax=Falsibacillus pallidus TaxID=493781 RepID=A0A370GF48_9BACI|nr:DUF899 family protein [Falsibacillus pallidus]RDI41900.1 putative dithiol-disulfide oxidoreductase (DUF899 family) [Falsibacillus pallidus]